MGRFADRFRREIQERDARLIAAARAKTPPGEPDPAAPPPGAWWRDDGLVREAAASTRSVGLACLMSLVVVLTSFMVAMMFWNAGGDILRGLGLMPASPTRHSSPGFALFMLAVIAPVALLWGSIALYTLFVIAGSTRVRLEGTTLGVSNGIGPLRMTKRVDAATVTGVREIIRVVQVKNGASVVKEVEIVRGTGKPIRIGGMLNENRRWWLEGMTRRMLGLDRGGSSTTSAGTKAV